MGHRRSSTSWHGSNASVRRAAHVRQDTCGGIITPTGRCGDEARIEARLERCVKPKRHAGFARSTRTAPIRINAPAWWMPVDDHAEDIACRRRHLRAHSGKNHDTLMQYDTDVRDRKYRKVLIIHPTPMDTANSNNQTPALTPSIPKPNLKLSRKKIWG